MSEEKNEIVVFILRSRDSKCSECDADIGHHGFLRKEGERGLCLDCADLGELVFLPSGDAALTRRATKYSPLRAVAVEWSRSRKRYERKGILVSEEAIEKAEVECLADADARERKRERNAGRRAQLDADSPLPCAHSIPAHQRASRRRSPPMPAASTRAASAAAPQPRSSTPK